MSGSLEVTPVRVFADADALGEALADEIVRLYEQRHGRFLLGCPGGRSLRTTYGALRRRAVDWGDLVTVLMDEYVVDGAAVPGGAHYSCSGFAQRELSFAGDVWLPDPAEPGAYDRRIDDSGGIDLFLLASGASDGHVAFLPPGSPLDGGTSVVELAETTRRDNLRTFPEFSSLDEVPTHGVTVGLGTIRASKRVRMVLHGEEKREAARRLLALDAFDPQWPASVVHACADAEIWLDRAALP